MKGHQEVLQKGILSLWVRSDAIRQARQQIRFSNWKRGGRHFRTK
jgi:hypothetical protein